MKMLIASLMLVSGSAMAFDDVISSRPDDYQTQVLSYCDGNTKINNVTATVENCEEQGLVCKSYVTDNLRLNKTTFTAACVAQ